MGRMWSENRREIEGIGEEKVQKASQKLKNWKSAGLLCIMVKFLKKK